MVKCDRCSGYGIIDCNECGGSGEYVVRGEPVPCRRCGRGGNPPGQLCCYACDGKGTRPR